VPARGPTGTFGPTPEHDRLGSSGYPPMASAQRDGTVTEARSRANRILAGWLARFPPLSSLSPVAIKSEDRLNQRARRPAHDGCAARLYPSHPTGHLGATTFQSESPITSGSHSNPARDSATTHQPSYAHFSQDIHRVVAPPVDGPRSGAVRLYMKGPAVLKPHRGHSDTGPTP
jgi:hypothetical protein